MFVVNSRIYAISVGTVSGINLDPVHVPLSWPLMVYAIKGTTWPKVGFGI